MKSRRRLVINLSIAVVTTFACCGAVLYLFLSFMLGSISAVGVNTCDPKTPTITEELGQFKFPPSMHNLQSNCFGIQGWIGNAQFEMSPADLDYFVSHLQIKPPLTNNGVPVDDDLATKATTFKSFLHGSYRTFYKNGNSFSQDVVIDTSSPLQYFVHINFGGG